MHYAVYINDLNIVKFWIEKYPELVDYADDKMLSVAGWAFFCGKVEILQFLLKNGAKVTSKENVRKNILRCSGYKTTDETVEELINFCLENNSLTQVCRYGKSLNVKTPRKLVTNLAFWRVGIIGKFVMA